MLAIVIPYYKRTFFEATMQSLAMQTNKRFKVYIGDDAGSESPLNLLEKYKGKFDFVYHRFESNLGSISLTQQWERCIALSRDEEWIMLLGDDDVLGENVIEEFYHQYHNFNCNCNVVRYASIVLNEQSVTTSDLFVHPRLENGLDFLIRKLKWETRSSLSEYFFRREAFLKYHFKSYPSAFYSDDRAWIDFSDNKPIYTINESVIYIRISDYSLSGTANIDVVKKAEFQYLKYFFCKKLWLFSKQDQLFVLRKMELSFYFNNITNIFLWLFLYFNFWRNYDSREIVRLHKRIIKKIISKKDKLINLTNKN